MSNMKFGSNFDMNKKAPSSRPLFYKRKTDAASSNVIHDLNNNKKRIQSEYDLSGLSNRLLLTETNPKQAAIPSFFSEGNDIKQTSIEQHLNDQLNQLHIPQEIIKGVHHSIGSSLQEIETHIINQRLSLSSVSKSVNDLISYQTVKDSISSNNNTAMAQESVIAIKDLKEKEEKIKKSLNKLDRSQKSLEMESYLNVSNNQIEVNIVKDRIKELKGRKERLMDRLEEINQQVIRVIDANKPLNRNENMLHFVENFDSTRDDYPSRRQRLERQSMQLKEQRLNDLTFAQEKKKKNLDQIEKEFIERKERFLTEHHEKETAIVKKRKEEMDSQMDKTKQFINEKQSKTEKDYLFYLNKEKFDFEQKKLFDKVKLQKKEELLSREEYLDFAKKLNQNKNELKAENAEKIGIMKEMWKNRSQLLPFFKNTLVTVLEEEKKKEREDETNMMQKRQKEIKDGIDYAEHVKKPRINKALKLEREARIFRMKNKRNVKRLRFQRKEIAIDIPKVTKMTKSELPQFTKPLKQLEMLPNYLNDLKKKREQSTSPLPTRNWEKELNDSKGTVIENLELLKIQTEVIDKKVAQKKQFMNANGGYAQHAEVGDSIGNLLIDSIKAKLMIINKLKAKSTQSPY